MTKTPFDETYNSIKLGCTKRNIKLFSQPNRKQVCMQVQTVIVGLGFSPCGEAC